MGSIQIVSACMIGSLEMQQTTSRCAIAPVLHTIIALLCDERLTIAISHPDAASAAILSVCVCVCVCVCVLWQQVPSTSVPHCLAELRQCIRRLSGLRSLPKASVGSGARYQPAATPYAGAWAT